MYTWADPFLSRPASQLYSTFWLTVIWRSPIGLCEKESHQWESLREYPNDVWEKNNWFLSQFTHYQPGACTRSLLIDDEIDKPTHYDAFWFVIFDSFLEILRIILVHTIRARWSHFNRNISFVISNPLRSVSIFESISSITIHPVPQHPHTHHRELKELPPMWSSATFPDSIFHSLQPWFPSFAQPVISVPFRIRPFPSIISSIFE
jgi:hypothetical protein